jgi:hypothetical protein
MNYRKSEAINWKSLVIGNWNWVQYEGEFEKNTFNGIGVIVFGNTEKFQGSFSEGLPHGTGLQSNYNHKF